MGKKNNKYSINLKELALKDESVAEKNLEFEFKSYKLQIFRSCNIFLSYNFTILQGFHKYNLTTTCNYMLRRVT